MVAGIRAAGDAVAEYHENDFANWPGVVPYPGADHCEWRGCAVALFYGLEGNLPNIFAWFRDRGRAAVYVDLGYFGRREGGRFAGYHKITVNARHPDAYFQSPKHPDDRFSRFGVQVQPWRDTGRHILLAGMSDKGALAEGYLPNEWEELAIAELLKHSHREIRYRAKPSWKWAKPLKGTTWCDPKGNLADDLEDCWAVVTHHSNVAVDALLAGIPVFCWGGVAARFGLQNLDAIESPYFPTGREQWAADIAYTQWSVAEMREGKAWRHLRTEGLI